MDVVPNHDLEAQKTSCHAKEPKAALFDRGSRGTPSLQSVAEKRTELSSTGEEQSIKRRKSRRSISEVASSARSTTGPTGSSSCSTSQFSGEEDVEDAGLFAFAEALGKVEPPGEPWFMEMTRLRRFHFMYLNKSLAACRKRILERRKASGDDMKELTTLLRDQANAIRDFQYIRSLDFLSPGKQQERYEQSLKYFPDTGHSDFDDVLPFETENYRCLPRPTKVDPFSDEVRELLRTHLPAAWSWTADEKKAKADLYHENKYKPTKLSPSAERLARFVVALAGALFILVPMYIMAIHQSRTKNLVTTTVAVVLFAMLCAVTLRTSNDQTLGATVGYAAVLMVFVGLTSRKDG